ncbi:1,3-beta-glucanosyltransferase Gas2p [[Candida] railenensis]|uniref:1,3-beta-glucanosyltransferase n=1 Tax=[Candida] railenensis TaxID=45579 RepID=A0A9P0QL20_9ASCO|nr:1,3-beta-glucanosyltransferase Gas2p [[Candida] railenensis]
MKMGFKGFVSIVVLFIFAPIALAKNSSAASIVPGYDNIAPIEIHNNFFYFKGTKTRFFIKGIAYQQVRVPGVNYVEKYIDPMANATSCLRDLEYMLELGVNLVRVYQINPELDHDVCMNEFAKKGIYVLADLAEPEMSINRESPTWDIQLFDRYKSVVDSMHKFNNVLGFFAGNEVTDSKDNTFAAPFVKAAVRDIKSYIFTSGYRKIPVGYATNDDAVIRMDISNYLVCGTHEVDFLGVNNYEWCGFSSYATSGYKERTIEYTNFPVPLFFSEYGCNNVQPRPFTEVEALYGSSMTGVWSGGIAYSYFESENHYGIVAEKANGTLTRLPDFEGLKQKLNSVQPMAAKSNAVPQTVVTINCPPLSSTWKVSSSSSNSSLPSTPDSGRCNCIQSTFSCIVSPRHGDIQAELVEEICSQVDCSAIQFDTANGTYGHLLGCSLHQKLSYVVNQYYLLKGKDPESCNFNGRAIIVNPSKLEELDEIYTPDGRTCKEAIGKSVSYRDEEGSIFLTPDKKTSFHSNYSLPESANIPSRSQLLGDKITSLASKIQLEKWPIYGSFFITSLIGYSYLIYT